MAYTVVVEKTVPVSRAKMFAGLMDFGGIVKLLPDMLETCRVEGEGVGAVRHFTLKGTSAEMAERLDCAYDERVFSYSIVTTPNPLGLEHYHAVVILADAPNGGCSVTWGSNWTTQAPLAEMKTNLSQLYVTLIDAIAAA